MDIRLQTVAKTPVLAGLVCDRLLGLRWQARMPNQRARGRERFLDGALVGSDLGYAIFLRQPQNPTDGVLQEGDEATGLLEGPYLERQEMHRLVEILQDATPRMALGFCARCLEPLNRIQRRCEFSGSGGALEDIVDLRRHRLGDVGADALGILEKFPHRVAHHFRLLERHRAW